MRNGTAFFKPAFLLPALALATVAIFSSCQKTSTDATDIGDWGNVAQIGRQPRTQAVSFILKTPGGDTSLYTGLGYNTYTGLRLYDFYRFDEATLTTYQVDSFPGIPVSGAAGFSIGAIGYVFGGFDGTTYYNTFWKFDPSQPAGQHPSAQWTELSIPNGPNPRTNAIGFNLNGNGYIGFGVDSTGYAFDDFWKFDGTTWTQQPSGGLDSRTSASVFLYGGQAYIVGGIANGGYLPSLQKYDPSTGIWTKMRKIINDGDSAYEADYGNNITRSAAAVFVINDTAYLTTGNYNGVISTTWAYDIGADQWFQKTSFEGTAREGATGFNINNHGYVVFGDNGSNSYSDMWQFYPDAAQTNNDNYAP